MNTNSQAWRTQHSEVESQNGTQPHVRSTAGRLAEQYNVSHNTIRRDAKLSEAIDAIGDISPEAKKILSGEVDVSKRDLESLSSKPNEGIETLAAEIEDGTYEK